jgi:chromosome segregation ATPase
LALELSELERSIESAKWSLKQLGSEKDAVLNEINEIKKQKPLISESVQRDISAERESLIVLKRECEIAKAKVDVLESERKTLLSNISSLNELVKTVESKKASLSSDMLVIGEKIADSNSKLLLLKSEINSKSDSMSVLSTEIAALKSQKTELQSEIGNLKGEYFFFQEKYKNESDALVKRESDMSFKEAMLDDRQKKLRDIKLFLEKEKGKAIPITI